MKCFRGVRRLLGLMLALLLICGCALAQQVSDSFFDVGRSALFQLESGDTQGALDTIAFQFDENDPTYTKEGFLKTVADKLAPSFDERPTIQETAVCFKMDNLWYLALPVSEPVNDRVPALVLISADQSVFSGYAALKWSSVLEMSNLAQESYWNVEYKPSGSLMADE